MPAATTSDLIAHRRAQLASIPNLTDFSCLLHRATRLARRVEWFATHGQCSAAGMLGPNGMGPEIDGLVVSARHEGFRVLEMAA